MAESKAIEESTGQDIDVDALYDNIMKPTNIENASSESANIKESAVSEGNIQGKDSPKVYDELLAPLKVERRR